jgi:uncharacterized protein with HEPN domain
LSDILASIAVIKQVAAQGEDAFMQSQILQGAALYNFIVIGEAVAQISEGLKTKYPDPKWRDIKDFRNLLIHGYMRTDLQVVWDIIRFDLGELQAQVETMLAE